MNISLNFRVYISAYMNIVTMNANTLVTNRFYTYLFEIFVFFFFTSWKHAVIYTIEFDRKTTTDREENVYNDFIVNVKKTGR